MKKTTFTFAVLAMTMLLISSCKKASTDAQCGSGLLCANVDGISYVASPYNSSTGFFGNNTYNGSYAQLIPTSQATGGYNLAVSGNNGNANTGATWQISFNITQLPVNGGTYSTSAGSATFDYYAGSASNQLHYTSDATHTGTVTINSIDTVNNLVSGTFSFTADEGTHNYTPTDHTITAGSFTNLLIRR